MRRHQWHYISVFFCLFVFFLTSWLGAQVENCTGISARTKIIVNSIVSTQECEYVYDESEENFERLELIEKPAVFDSWSQRLDYIHNNLTYDMQSYVDKADSVFVDSSAPGKPIPASRFRLGIYAEAEENGGVKLRLSPDIDADIRIPNIESRLRLFIDTKNSDDLPGTTVMERDPGFNAGLRKVTRWFRYDAGVKVRIPPVLFGRIDWRPNWRAREWKVNPLGRIYWESDDGYGALSSLSAYRYIGKRVLIQSVTAAKWTEKSNSEDEPPEDPDEYYESNAGMEWEQTFMVGYINKMLSSKSVGQSVSFKKVAKATGLRVSVFGNTERVSGAERVRLSIGHRRPVYKDWMFIMITPELEWYKENDWEFVPRIRIGLDMLFSVGDVQRNK